MSELSQLRKTSVRIKKAPVRLISEHCDFNRQHKSIQYKKLVQERRMKIKQVCVWLLLLNFFMVDEKFIFIFLFFVKKLKSKLSKATQFNSGSNDYHQTSNLYKAEVSF